MLTRQTCFRQQRIISGFVNAHQSTQEDYTADMGQIVTTLKLKKKMNGVSKQNLVGAAVSTYEHTPPCSEAEANQPHLGRATAGPISICSLPTTTKTYCCIQRVASLE